jgi:hypothetical protein
VNIDLDVGYYKDRDSDADTGDRDEVVDDEAGREQILRTIVILSHTLSNTAEASMQFAEKAQREALRELGEFNAEKN